MHMLIELKEYNYKEKNEIFAKIIPSAGEPLLKQERYDFSNFKSPFKLSYVVYFQKSMTTCGNLNHFINVNKTRVFKEHTKLVQKF